VILLRLKIILFEEEIVNAGELSAYIFVILEGLIPESVKKALLGLFAFA